MIMKGISQNDSWLVDKFYARFGDGKSKLGHPPTMTGMYDGLRQKLFDGGVSYEEICEYWLRFKNTMVDIDITMVEIDHNTLSLFRDYLLWKKHKYSFSDLENAAYLKSLFQQEYRDEMIEVILKDKI